MNCFVSSVEEVIAEEKQFTGKDGPWQMIVSMRTALYILASENHPDAERLILRLLNSVVRKFRWIAVNAANMMDEPSDAVITGLEDILTNDDRDALFRC